MEGLVAVQVLVTVSVLPAVVSDLGGVGLFGAALSSEQAATVIVLPFTPRLVTRWGLRGAFYASLAAFVAGSLVVISAPVAWVFVAGLFIQGAGAGAQYALLPAVFTRRDSLRLRPRRYAPLAVAWGPPGAPRPALRRVLRARAGMALGVRTHPAARRTGGVDAAPVAHRTHRAGRAHGRGQPDEHLHADRLRREHARPRGRTHGLGAARRAAGPPLRGRSRGDAGS